jgi:hypothetical protein
VRAILSIREHDERTACVKLTLVRGTCPDNTCPSLFETDRGTVVVQGAVVTDADALLALNLPPDESAVEVPRALIFGPAER